MHAIASQSRALAWWPADQQFVHLTSGNVDTWTDYVGGKTLTDQGTAGYRPAWSGSSPQQPTVYFDGTKLLTGATGVIDGRTDLTYIAVMKFGTLVDAAGTVLAYTFSPNSSGNRSFFYQPLAGSSRLGSYTSDAGGTGCEWDTTSGVNTSAFHVYVARQNWPDGATSAKAIRVDGADLAGAYSLSGNDSTGNVGNHSLMVGGLADNTYRGVFYATDFLLCPLLSDADADAVYQLLRQLRGLP